MDDEERFPAYYRNLLIRLCREWCEIKARVVVAREGKKPVTAVLENKHAQQLKNIIGKNYIPMAKIFGTRDIKAVAEMSYNKLG